MANLDIIRWEKWAPAIGNNLKLPVAKRFHLEVSVGLTKLQLQELSKSFTAPPEAPKDETAEAKAARLEAAEKQLLDEQAERWGQYVRVKGEHRIGGRVVKDLRGYLEAIPQGLRSDVGRALFHLNSLGGQAQLFYARSFGGLPTTDDPADDEDD